MSMLGLAPVAAAMTPVGAGALNGDPVMQNYVPFSGFSQSETPTISEIDYAKKHVDAVRWLNEKNVPNGNEPYVYADPGVHVESMRSWSSSYREQRKSELRLKKDYEVRIKQAELRFNRELKLSLAPEWVRRFM